MLLTEIPPEEIVSSLFPENDGYTYSLPSITDDQDAALVDIEVSGLNETFSSYKVEDLVI